MIATLPGLPRANDAVDRAIAKIAYGDLFCGAGGFTSGAELAWREIGVEGHAVVVNHDPDAVGSHSDNHVHADHYCIDLDAARPEQLVPSGHLHLLLASPSCTHHSVARGGKPKNDQRRADPFHILRWATAISIDVIIVENVGEIVTWTGVDAAGNTIGEPGAYFDAWVASLKIIGYEVEWRILNAADYGTAQTRRRFILVARKDGRQIRWPERTHAPREIAASLGLKPYEAALTCINFDHPTASVFDRDGKKGKKKLARATMRRVAVGSCRFGGPTWPYQLRAFVQDGLLPLEDAKKIADSHLRRMERDAKKTGTVSMPFIFANRTNNVARAGTDPAATITTATGGSLMLAEPHIDGFTLGQQSGAVTRGLADPMATVATGGAIRVGSFTFGQHTGSGVRSTDDPASAVTCVARIRLAQAKVDPYLLDVNHTGSDESRVRGSDEPMKTITAGRRGLAVAEPFVTAFYGDSNSASRAPKSGAEPFGTLTTANRFGLAEPHFAILRGTGTARSTQLPTPAVTAQGNHIALLEPTVDEPEPFLYPRHGERASQQPRTHGSGEPMPTITATVNPNVVVPTVDSAIGEGALVEIDSFATLREHVAAVLETELAMENAPQGGRIIAVGPLVWHFDLSVRMLQVDELAKAQDFHRLGRPYVLRGNKTTQTRLVGNAVPVLLAKAVVQANMAELAAGLIENEQPRNNVVPITATRKRSAKAA